MAKQLFQTTGKPQVIVYQKLAPPEKQEQSLKNFINSLIANPQDEYFCGQYEIFDTLQLKFEKELNHYYKKYFAVTEVQKDEQKENISIVQHGEKSVAIAKNDGNLNFTIN